MCISSHIPATKSLFFWPGCFFNTSPDNLHFHFEGAILLNSPPPSSLCRINGEISSNKQGFICTCHNFYQMQRKGTQLQLSVSEGSWPKLLQSSVCYPFSRSQDQTYSWRRCGVAQQGASKQLSVSLIHCKGTLWRNSSFTDTCLLQCCLFFPLKKIMKTTRCSKLIKNMPFIPLHFYWNTHPQISWHSNPSPRPDVLTKYIKVVTRDLSMHWQLG